MTTSSYFGVSRPFGRIGGNNITVGSSSTATTEIELRVMVVTTTGAHNMTKAEVMHALEQLRVYLMNADLYGGEGGASSNIPLPIGAPQAGS